MSNSPYCGSRRGRIEAWILRASSKMLSMRVAADLLVDAVAQDAEREEDVVPVVARGDVEGEDVLLAPHLDGGELLHPQEVLQVAVDVAGPRTSM